MCQCSKVRKILDLRSLSFLFSGLILPIMKIVWSYFILLDIIGLQTPVDLI